MTNNALKLIRFAKTESDDHVLILRMRFERKNGRILSPAEAVYLCRWLLGENRISPIFELIHLIRQDQPDDAWIDELESKVYWGIGQRDLALELAEAAYAKWGGEEFWALIEGYKELQKNHGK